MQWASSSSLASLQLLSLKNTSINGSLPDAWAGTASTPAMPQLTYFYLDDCNGITGAPFLVLNIVRNGVGCVVLDVNFVADFSAEICLSKHLCSHWLRHSRPIETLHCASSLEEEHTAKLRITLQIGFSGVPCCQSSLPFIPAAPSLAFLHMLSGAFDTEV